jgi:hypothetical protein
MHKSASKDIFLYTTDPVGTDMIDRFPNQVHLLAFLLNQYSAGWLVAHWADETPIPTLQSLHRDLCFLRHKLSSNRPFRINDWAIRVSHRAPRQYWARLPGQLQSLRKGIISPTLHAGGDRYPFEVLAAASTDRKVLRQLLADFRKKEPSVGALLYFKK